VALVPFARVVLLEEVSDAELEPTYVVPLTGTVLILLYTVDITVVIKGTVVAVEFKLVIVELTNDDVVFPYGGQVVPVRVDGYVTPVPEDMLSVLIVLEVVTLKYDDVVVIEVVVEFDVVSLVVETLRLDVVTLS
jgi:hypothetical protein